MIAVSAVIPTLNKRPLLLRLLDTLRAQSYPLAEILVIDNGSGVPLDAPGVRVIALDSNRGFAHAVNRGIAEARGDAIAILNDDVELRPDWLAALTATFSDPDVWFSCGKLLSAANPALLDGTFDLISRAACPWRAGHGLPAHHPAFSTPRPIALAPMTASLYRAELFRRIGPLDERFESYLEDVDFSLRCAAHGLAGFYQPAAVAVHHGSATLGRWHPATVRRLARNMAWLVDKHYPADLRRRWAAPIRAGQLAWGLVALRHGTFAAWRAGRGEARLTPLPFEGARSVEQAIMESERQLLNLQRGSGWDAYWRLYALLAGEL